MVLPHRAKAGTTTEADRTERGAASLLRRRDRGRHLEEEWRAEWDGSLPGEATLDLRHLEDTDEDGPTEAPAVADRWEADSTGEIPTLADPPPLKIRVGPALAAPLAGTPVAARPVTGSPGGPVPAGSPGAGATLSAREAVMRFRRTAVAMALNAGTAEASRADARDCAASLTALAAGGHEDMLGAILKADPAAAEEATWTVACYQIGDLSPSALRDYAEAAPAVLTLAGCETASHVAAELIVTNGDGVRWTALVRSGADVAYQPLTPATATAATPAGLMAVRHRWEDQLLLWVSSPDHGLHEPAAPAAVEAQPAAASAESAAMGAVLGQVLEAVRHIEQRLPDPAVPAREPDGEIHRRVTALESASDGLLAMKADLERVSRSAQYLEEQLRVAQERIAASDARAAVLETRIAELSRPASRPGRVVERMAVRPEPPGLGVLLARWMAARLTHWSDRRHQPGVPITRFRSIELVPADERRSDWSQ